MSSFEVFEKLLINVMSWELPAFPHFRKAYAPGLSSTRICTLPQVAQSAVAKCGDEKKL